MNEARVSFDSADVSLEGIYRTPESPGPHAGIVQGPGWLGLADAQLYVPYHQAFCDAGMAVLIFDYRGFGDSGGDRGTISPTMQLEDLANAVSYLAERADIDATRIGVFGSGGTGGGNAVMLAATDARVRCAVSQVPVSDGRDWLRRMRTPAEWDSFLDRLEADQRRIDATGEGERVHPREDIMVPTAERRATNIKQDVDGRIPTDVPLAAAYEIMAYRPIDAAGQSAPLLVVAVEDDLTTPTDHAVALYEAAPEPKAMILQKNTTHYAAYRQYGNLVRPKMVAWFSHFLLGAEAVFMGVEIIGGPD